MSALTVDALQVALNARQGQLVSKLKAQGWTMDTRGGFLRQGDITIFLSTGCQSIQRHLKLPVVAYAHYNVKTVHTAADIVEDNLQVSVDDTLARINRAIDNASLALAA